MKPVATLLWRLTLICLFACLFASCEKRTTIVNMLDEREANEIIVFLSGRGFDAKKERNITGGGGGGEAAATWNISVPADQTTEAMSLLNQQGLPRRRGENLLKLFGNSQLVPSELQEKVRLQAGLGEQIANTIRKMDGVLDAEVQISYPEEDPLNPKANEKKKITAAVYVKHSGVLDDPNAHLSTRIKRLVAGSVTGLDIDNVTVILDRARFADVALGSLSNESEQEYVTIWNIVLAKESVTRFRVIFFTFLILLLFLIATLLWLLWKMMPLLKEYGGPAALFQLQPLKKNEPLEGENAELPAAEQKPKSDEDEEDESIT